MNITLTQNDPLARKVVVVHRLGTPTLTSSITGTDLTLTSDRDGFYDVVVLDSDEKVIYDAAPTTYDFETLEVDDAAMVESVDEVIDLSGFVAVDVYSIFTRTRDVNLENESSWVLLADEYEVV